MRFRNHLVSTGAPGKALAGRGSDFELVLVGPSLSGRDRALGIGTRAGWTRTGPVSPAQVRKRCQPNVPQGGRSAPPNPRWPASDGWVKMQQMVQPGGREGPINVDYLLNRTTGAIDDFKNVLPGPR